MNTVLDYRTLRAVESYAIASQLLDEAISEFDAGIIGRKPYLEALERHERATMLILEAMGVEKGIDWIVENG